MTRRSSISAHNGVVAAFIVVALALVVLGISGGITSGRSNERLQSTTLSSSLSSQAIPSATAVPNVVEYDVHDTLSPMSQATISAVAENNSISVVSGVQEFSTSFLDAAFSQTGSFEKVALSNATSVQAEVGSFTNDMVGEDVDNSGDVTSGPSFVDVPAYVVSLGGVPLNSIMVGGASTGTEPELATPFSGTVTYHFVYNALTHQLLYSF